MDTNTQQKRGAEQVDGLAGRVQLNPTTVDIEKEKEASDSNDTLG